MLGGDLVTLLEDAGPLGTMSEGAQAGQKDNKSTRTIK